MPSVRALPLLCFADAVLPAVTKLVAGAVARRGVAWCRSVWLQPLTAAPPRSTPCLAVACPNRACHRHCPCGRCGQSERTNKGPDRGISPRLTLALRVIERTNKGCGAGLCSLAENGLTQKQSSPRTSKIQRRQTCCEQSQAIEQRVGSGSRWALLARHYLRRDSTD